MLNLTTHLLFFKSNGFPSPLGEGLGARSTAAQFLKAAAVSTEKAVEMMKLTKRQIEVAMFACGAKEIRELEHGKLIEMESG